MKAEGIKFENNNDKLIFSYLRRALNELGFLKKYGITIDKMVSKCYRSRNMYVKNGHETLYQNMVYWPSDLGLESLHAIITKCFFISKLVNDNVLNISDMTKPFFDEMGSSYKYLPKYLVSDEIIDSIILLEKIATKKYFYEESRKLRVAKEILEKK